MYIAHKLRKSNIAEYLLYMWQVEDLVRAYNFSLSTIKREYISKFDVSDDEKEEMTDWYGDIIRMMNGEGCREKGHLQINKNIVADLNDLHAQLLQSTKFPFYNSEYYRVLPFIVELRHKGSHNDENEIETCFNALYGIMMLRLQKKEVSPDTEHAIKEITTFIGMLNDYYMKDKTEGIDFDED